MFFYVWQDISWTQPEENKSVPTADQHEPNKKVNSFYYCIFSLYTICLLLQVLFLQ